MSSFLGFWSVVASIVAGVSLVVMVYRTYTRSGEDSLLIEDVPLLAFGLACLLAATSAVFALLGARLSSVGPDSSQRVENPDTNEAMAAWLKDHRSLAALQKEIASDQGLMPTLLDSRMTILRSRNVDSTRRLSSLDLGKGKIRVATDRATSQLEYDALTIGAIRTLRSEIKAVDPAAEPAADREKLNKILAQVERILAEIDLLEKLSAL